MRVWAGFSKTRGHQATSGRPEYSHRSPSRKLRKGAMRPAIRGSVHFGFFSRRHVEIVGLSPGGKPACCCTGGTNVTIPPGISVLCATIATILSRTIVFCATSAAILSRTIVLCATSATILSKSHDHGMNVDQKRIRVMRMKCSVICNRINVVRKKMRVMRVKISAIVTVW